MERTEKTPIGFWFFPILSILLLGSDSRFSPSGLTKNDAPVFLGLQPRLSHDGPSALENPA
jgi:hypothetical protein